MLIYLASTITPQSVSKLKAYSTLKKHIAIKPLHSPTSWKHCLLRGSQFTFSGQIWAFCTSKAPTRKERHWLNHLWIISVILYSCQKHSSKTDIICHHECLRGIKGNTEKKPSTKRKFSATKPQKFKYDIFIFHFFCMWEFHSMPHNHARLL